MAASTCGLHPTHAIPGLLGPEWASESPRHPAQVGHPPTRCPYRAAAHSPRHRRSCWTGSGPSHTGICPSWRHTAALHVGAAVGCRGGAPTATLGSARTGATRGRPIATCRRLTLRIGAQAGEGCGSHRFGCRAPRKDGGARGGRRAAGGVRGIKPNQPNAKHAAGAPTCTARCRRADGVFAKDRGCKCVAAPGSGRQAAGPAAGTGMWRSSSEQVKKPWLQNCSGATSRVKSRLLAARYYAPRSSCLPRRAPAAAECRCAHPVACCCKAGRGRSCRHRRRMAEGSTRHRLPSKNMHVCSPRTAASSGSRGHQPAPNRLGSSAAAAFTSAAGGGWPVATPPLALLLLLLLLAPGSFLSAFMVLPVSDAT